MDRDRNDISGAGTEGERVEAGLGGESGLVRRRSVRGSDGAADRWVGFACGIVCVAKPGFDDPRGAQRRGARAIEE